MRFIEVEYDTLINVDEILTVRKNVKNNQTEISFIKRAGQEYTSEASWECSIESYNRIKEKLTQLGIEIY